MFRFFLTAMLVLSGGAHLYVWLKMRAASVSVGWRAAFIILGILGNAAIFCGRPARGMLTGSMARWPGIISNIGFTWLVLILLTFLSLVAVELLGLVLSIAKIKISPRGVLTFGLTFGLTVFLWGLGEAYFVQRRDVEITSSKLPEGLERLRIVHLTDIHFGGLYTKSHFERVLNIVREAQPDLILMTGDLVDDDMRFWEDERDMLLEVTRTAPLGAYGVNGNHEYYARMMYGVDTDEFISNCGFTLLNDQRTEIPGTNILLVGFDDSVSAHIGDLVQPEGDDRDKFVLVLKHRPNPPDDAEGKFDLQVSGHTHGGQIWPFGYISSRANGNSVQGLVQRSGGLIFTSNGAGFWGPPMRIGVTPWVTVIDILRANDNNDNNGANISDGAASAVTGG